MKRLTIIIILLNLITSVSFSQLYKTAKVKVKSGEKLIKEVYYVRKNERYIKEGMYIQFYKRVKIIEGKYSNNMKNGIWNYYDYLEKLNFSGNYVDDLKDGKWTYIYNDQVASEIYYSQGVPDSSFGYHINGILAYEVKHYNNGDGLCKSFYDNGNLKEIIPLKNREPHGIYKLYFENGQLHRETLFLESKVTSIISMYEKNGNEINAGDIKDGKGSYITFHMPENDEGTKLKKYAVQKYYNGILNGPCQYYRRNGNLESAGLFEDGNRVGEWKKYNEDGSLKTIFNYDSETYQKIKQKEQGVYYTVNEINEGDIIPEFQGGDKERINFLYNNLKYPFEARFKEIEGTVYINFIITKTGELESVKIIKSVNKQLDNEVIRVINEMPRWNPGLENGIPVRVSFNLPIVFKLN